MITRRTFLTRGIAAFAGTVALSSGLATPALANHKNGGEALDRTREMLRDGSGVGSPEGHAHNHGEESMRSEGTPVLGGTPRTAEDRGQRDGGHDGECPYETGECPNGTGVCDGSGPDD